MEPRLRKGEIVTVLWNPIHDDGNLIAYSNQDLAVIEGVRKRFLTVKTMFDGQLRKIDRNNKELVKSPSEGDINLYSDRCRRRYVLHHQLVLF